MRLQLNSDLVLIARTDSLDVSGGSLDQAIDRVNRYLNAGADWAFVEGPTTVEDIARLVRDVNGPLVYNQAGASPHRTTEELRELGVRVVLIPGAMLRAGLYAMHDHASQLRARGADADADFAARTANHPLTNLHTFAGFDQIRTWRAEFGPTTGG